MATKRDYYEILGVSKSAGLDEIKKAVREKISAHLRTIQAQGNHQAA